MLKQYKKAGKLILSEIKNIENLAIKPGKRFDKTVFLCYSRSILFSCHNNWQLNDTTTQQATNKKRKINHV